MPIDWAVVATIAAPLLALFIGALLDRALERKPKLVTYLGHASAFKLQAEGKDPIQIHTHAVVVRNAGKRTAHNVRLGHPYLPNHQVFPSIAYEVVPLPEGGSEIVVPRLVAGEQITISYLYYPPLLWSQVNTHVKSDEGFAKVLNVLPTPQQPAWVLRILSVLLFIGALSSLYLLYEAARHL